MNPQQAPQALKNADPAIQADPNQESKTTVQSIFQEHIPEYILKNKATLWGQQKKIIYDVSSCMTRKMGGRRYRCKDCGHLMKVYKKCGNRHCPTCGAGIRRKWVNQQIKELLPFPYVHIVFRLPDKVTTTLYSNEEKREVYKAMFDAVNHAIERVLRRYKLKTAYWAILHTWGSNMSFHVHIHVMIAGYGVKIQKGRVTAFQEIIFEAEELEKHYKERFLVEYKKTSRHKRCIEMESGSMFMTYGHKSPYLPSEQELEDANWKPFIEPITQKREVVVGYLGKYYNRVAITDDDIIALKDGIVQFKGSDDENGSVTIHTLKVDEFIRRFLRHEIPNKFRRVRSYGLASTKNKELLREVCKQLDSLVADVPALTQFLYSVAKPSQFLTEDDETEFKSRRCKKCGGLYIYEYDMDPVRYDGLNTSWGGEDDG